MKPLDDNARLVAGTLPHDPFADAAPMAPANGVVRALRAPRKAAPVGPGEGQTHAETDLRNAERFVEMHGDSVRFVGLWKKWLVFDGKRWALDETGAAMRLAQDTARRILAEANAAHARAAEQKADAIAAVGADDGGLVQRTSGDAISKAEDALGRAKRAVSWAIKSQSAPRLNAMLELARPHPRLAIHPKELDADPWSFNVANGTLDLRTGKLRTHRREDLITKLAPVSFDATATCPTWNAFLARAMANHAPMLGFVQRMQGYALTGEIREHVLGFLFGGGANGKSTFLGVVRDMMGDYAVTAPRGLLFRSRGERHPTELTTLFGARFVTCAEVEEGQAFDEALVKDLSGGDDISARRMCEDFWTFKPSHKLFLAGNHKPTVKGDDDGIWRRIRLVPWTVTIPPEERDAALPEKLRAELSGILAWAVRGCLEWQKSGLGEPAEVTAATAAYREESDALGEFLRSHCTFNAEGRIARRELRRAYEEWCEGEGRQPVGATRFSQRLRREGARDTSVRVDTTASPVDGWAGVRLKHAAERAREADRDA